MKQDLTWGSETWGSRRDSRDQEIEESLDRTVSLDIVSRPSQRFPVSVQKDKLRRILEVNEDIEARKTAEGALREKKRKGSLYTRISSLEGHELELLIDSNMSLVIILNAIFIGVSLDHDKNLDDDHRMTGWQVVDIVFTCIFVVELVTKCFLHGFSAHYCGKDKYSNTFDSLLIFLDATQMVIGLSMPETSRKMQDAGIPAASLFRIVRLVRLTRLIRLLRTEYFKDLLSMLQGMAGGALTLLWAVVVFFLMVYVVALICREFFGSDITPIANVTKYFENVPRSMFTVFRCSFGDCSTDGGVPIPEHISAEFGGAYAILYCFFVFMITIGLFNVISAIFVDSTMSAQADIATKRAQERLEDEERWAESVATIIREMLIAESQSSERSPDSMDTKLSERAAITGPYLVQNFESICSVEFHRDTLDRAVHKDHPDSKNVRHALLNLDIDPTDQKRLSDILDPDHSGTVSVLELTEGLKRLRGDPRRSDVVTCDLMIRSLQEKVDDIHDRVKGLYDHLSPHYDHLSPHLSPKLPQEPWGAKRKKDGNGCSASNNAMSLSNLVKDASNKSLSMRRIELEQPCDVTVV